jgi:ParB family chromosome partitioning protein
MGSLIPGASPAERRGIVQLGIEEIVADKLQPRRHFAEAQLDELADSIKAKGVLLPLLVRRAPNGQVGYIIIAGERRWRASQRAGLREVPALVREVTESEAFELALIENIQREELNPIEEAEAYHRLVSEFGLTQEKLAERVGKERSTVANSLRLLRLPEKIKRAIVEGTLSMGHARALLGIADEGDLAKAAEKVIAEQLSVRGAEQLVQRIKSKQGGKKAAGETSSVQVRHVVEKLQRKLGSKVELKDRGGKGELVVHYGSLADLDRILAAVLGE